MRRSLPSLVAVASSVVLAVSIAGAGELRGRLLLGEHPAAGVTLSALSFEAPLDQARREARDAPALPPLATATSAPDGSFVLSVPAERGKEKLFTVRADGGGTVPVQFGGVWEAGESADLGEHLLERGEKLDGKVIDTAGAPVAGAEVVLVASLERIEEPDLEAASRSTRTAADGSFHFSDAAAGSTITVEKSGWLVAVRTAVKSGVLGRAIALETGVPLTGVVRKTDEKSPAPGALVRVEGRVTTRWVTAGADGSFSIPNAPPGLVTVVADAGETGYVERSEVRLPLPAGKTLGLLLRPPSTLTGRTIDARTGKPVARTRIEMRSGKRLLSTRSGPEGVYVLSTLPPRSWRLRADEPRYVPWIHDNVTVRIGETRKLDVPLVPGSTLTGRVADETGKPVAGAKGFLLPPVDGSLLRVVRRMRDAGTPIFRTRPDGTFKASRLAPGGNQVLVVSHPDFQRATLGGLVLLPGATKTGLSVLLKRGALLTGVVKDAAGQPIVGARAELSQGRDLFSGGARGGAGALARANLARGAGADHKGDTTGADGQFTIRGGAPGEYALTVERPGYSTTRVEPVKIPETGAPAPLEVTLPPGVSISGRVVRGSGEGAEGFVVSAEPPGRRRFGVGGGISSDQPTGSDGAFAIDGLKTGQTYDLQLMGSTGPGERKHGVTAPASDVQIKVTGTGRITGTVVDAKSGLPIPDFQITYGPDRGRGFGLAGLGGARGAGPGARGGPGQPVIVHDDGGAFVLEEVPAGTWSVLVTASGYQPARAGGVVVDEGGTRDSVEVRIAKGSSLKGHVVDAVTGAAVPNATVSLGPSGAPAVLGALMTEAAGGEITTDADGRFEIDGVGTGKQTLTVTHADHADAAQPVDVKEGGAVVEIRISQGGVLAGVVTSDAGQPLPGAEVSLTQEGGGAFGFFGDAGGQTGIADSAGSFRFDHLGAGRYTLAASLGSRTSAPSEVVLQAGQSQENLAVRLQTGVTIQGSVSGLPDATVSGMMINASSAETYSQSTRAGADGSFEFDNVPPGIVTLRGTATDSTGSTRSATRQVTTPADQPIVTTQLVFEPGFSLSGHVIRAGQPVSGVTVFAVLQGGGGRQASSVTDAGGGYQLGGLQEGTYTVSATSDLWGGAGGGSSKRQTVTLTSDQTLDITFPNATIAGQVVDANGKTPLANARVTIASQDPGQPGRAAQRPATTDSGGRFSFANLDEATYTLTTTATDYLLDTRPVTASDPGPEGLVVELTRGAGIGIKVQDGVFGVPLRGVTVRILDGRSVTVVGPSSITLDSDGQGEVPSLQPGIYTVLATATGYAAVRLEGVSVPAPVVSISLTPGGTLLVQAGPKTLAAGTATGTITAPSGQPALLSLFNVDGRFAISEPSLQVQHLAPGSYVLTIPAAGFSNSFTATEGGTTVVQLP